MSILTFIGGVHPYDGKAISKDGPICEYKPKGEVAIALSQHIGAPAVPVVNPGDKVLAGQLIAQALIFPMVSVSDFGIIADTEYFGSPSFTALGSQQCR